MRADATSISAQGRLAVDEILALDDEDAFRAAVRAWFTAELRRVAGPKLGRAAMHDLAFRRAWDDHVCRAGWAGLGWPKAHGGRDLPLSRQAIVHEEYARAGAPLPMNAIGHGILAPTLILFGSEAQKLRFLPPLLANKEIWCQGYSEPNAGSDLAALQTSARCEGDAYRLTGQKIWTSFANMADWCFVLARTDPEAKRHRGISFILVDLRSPGVTVRPIRQITGEAEFNEVFFDDVRVPAENLVGEENGGWRIAMAAAGFERGTYFIPRLVRLQIELEGVVRLAAGLHRDGMRRIDDPLIRDRIARLATNVHALRLNAYRMLAQAMRGDPPGAEGSIVKLMWSETHQQVMDLAMDLLGPRARLGPQESTATQEGRWQRDYLWTRAETILAGTSEIQRNIIAERGLGLPRA